MRKAKQMSKINFEEDVANIDQTGLESVAELLRKQYRWKLKQKQKKQL